MSVVVPVPVEEASAPVPARICVSRGRRGMK